jgi:hypothetical protein
MTTDDEKERARWGTPTTAQAHSKQQTKNVNKQPCLLTTKDQEE